MYGMITIYWTHDLTTNLHNGHCVMQQPNASLGVQ